MIHLMTKGKSNNHLTLILALVLLILLTGILYFSIPVIKKTDLYKNYENNKEVTFVSKRANFSFKHPNWWPVAQEPDEELKIDNDIVERYSNDPSITLGDEEKFKRIEDIDFEEKWIRNAGGPRLGFIFVRETQYKSLKDYVSELSKEKVVDVYTKGQTKKVTFKPPKIEYLKIGGEDAISTTYKDDLATFSRSIADYQLIRNGWLYRFVTVDSSRFLEDKEKNSKTFQQIISSVKFF